MKRIAISIRNRVFAESIFLMLKQTGDFQPFRIPASSREEVLIECRTVRPQILLMDVAPSPEDSALQKRLELVSAMRKEQPGCKQVLLCDETAYPELAREVMRARQTGQIDHFFYASVTAEYLAAALDAL